MTNTAHNYKQYIMLYVQKVLNKAEWLRRKPNELHNKNNCFSMIYEQIENYNLS